MTSNYGVQRQPTRAIILLTKIKSTARRSTMRLSATTMRLGATTMAFFRKGEELEATDFENLPHDDPALVPPKLGFRNFDRVPRRRTPLVLAFLLLIATGVTAFGRDHFPEARAEAAQAATVVGAKAATGWAYVKQLVAGKHGAP
jgi:hypothetical protein